MWDGEKKEAAAAPAATASVGDQGRRAGAPGGM